MGGAVRRGGSGVRRGTARGAAQAAHGERGRSERGARHVLEAVPRPAGGHGEEGGRLRGEARGPPGEGDALRHERQPAEGARAHPGDEGGRPRPPLRGHGDLRDKFHLRAVRARAERADRPRRPPARRAPRLRTRDDLQAALQRRPLQRARVHGRRDPLRAPGRGRRDRSAHGRREGGRGDPPVVRRRARPPRPPPRAHRPHGPRAGGDVRHAGRPHGRLAHVRLPRRALRAGRDPAVLPKPRRGGGRGDEGAHPRLL